MTKEQDKIENWEENIWEWDFNKEPRTCLIDYIRQLLSDQKSRLLSDKIKEIKKLPEFTHGFEDHTKENMNGCYKCGISQGLYKVISILKQ